MLSELLNEGDRAMQIQWIAQVINKADRIHRFSCLLVFFIDGENEF